MKPCKMSPMLKCQLRIPPLGVLEPGGPTDPLKYYYSPIVGFLYRWRVEQAISLLHPPYRSILEVGYGSGVLLPTLACFGDELFGVDLESDPVKVGQRLRPLNLHVTLARGDARDMDYPDGRFDLVVAISVFEHIQPVAPVLNEVFRILEPGGHLLVGMPRVDRWMERLFPLIGFKDIQDLHVTNHRQFLKTAYDNFELVTFAHIPPFLPQQVGLYFNMLLRRRQ